jgi:hypothetical protein
LLPLLPKLWFTQLEVWKLLHPIYAALHRQLWAVRNFCFTEADELIESLVSPISILIFMFSPTVDVEGH